MRFLLGPLLGHWSSLDRLVCEDEQMFSSVEDVELGVVKHAAGILLDGGEVIDGHLELLLGLRDLLPLQDGARPSVFFLATASTSSVAF